MKEKTNKNTTHLCIKNIPNDVKIKYDKINVSEWSWVLDQSWYATKEEVKDGLAEKDGEEIVSHRLLISFCPFCGKALG